MPDAGTSESIPVEEERCDQPPLSVPDAIRARRAARDFDVRPVPDALLDEILDDARRAPSGYNLQPTHFVVVRGERRAALARAALNQRQIVAAPVTVALVVDLQVHRNHLEAVLDADRAVGSIDDRYAGFMRRMVRLSFGRGPFGILAAAKRVTTIVLGRFRAVPAFPAAEPAAWARAQAMLVASHLMLSAASRGVASCPMEGFGEVQVRRVLGVPPGYRVALLIALGYAPDAEVAPRRSRLSLDRLVHRGRW
ncbi:MAG: nitroreductase family protein [Planctomycetes bacterium]|nr:nitroreductase family protein [Planctomycetota bacterium]